MGTKELPGGKRAPAGQALSWATESLPMSVRKELLERELVQLGFRKREGAQQQQQPQAAPQRRSPGRPA